MPSAAANHREDVIWDGAPSMRMVWVRLGLTVGVILVIETVLTSVFGFSGHWTRLLVYMGYLVALPVAVGSMWVRQKSEKYRLTENFLDTTYGLIKKRREQMDTRNYKDSSCTNSSWLQLLAGCGDIKVISCDDSHPVLVLRDLEDYLTAWEHIKMVGLRKRRLVVGSSNENDGAPPSNARRGAAAIDGQ
ncbi:MAG: hypothetical protein N2111_12045 [Candidatus Sumerlaeaceae bacterium]|nr:hypothetical protein [Candidatus Sumerlaeaceae bacterium]